MEVDFYVEKEQDTSVINDHSDTVLAVSGKGELIGYPEEDSTKGRVTYIDSIGNYKVKALLLDSTYWISIDKNFAIFDSMTVNPYRVDPVKFKDTLIIQLADSLLTDSTRYWAMPLRLKHETTSKFGARWSRWHYGTDLRLKIGDSVTSVFDGVVRVSKYNRGGYGWYILVRHHNGLETIYGHLTKNLVHVGDTVKAGQLIGWGGNTGRSTGPHLHFEVRWQGNAIDPEDLFDFKNDTILALSYEMTPKAYDYVRKMRAKVYHRIRRGDTLYGLARKYRVSVGQICRLNGISRRKVLRVGRTLRIR